MISHEIGFRYGVQRGVVAFPHWIVRTMLGMKTAHLEVSIRQAISTRLTFQMTSNLPYLNKPCYLALSYSVTVSRTTSSNVVTPSPA